MPSVHPCLACGACCVALRVSFYFGECFGDDGVPAELVTEVTPFRVAMLGTGDRPPRCVALDGQPGREVSCRIWPRRPTPCREFAASYEDGTRHDRCDDVRARIGLPALTPEDWRDVSPPTDPPAPGTPPAADRR